ncbi:hypothetical protein HELRODRAFT_175208 [Helobdella robusta]|uniref:Uncharacterized protein n=1 Tax=Helobdella robusta TaxID=6412 RepID=T1F904_HELRO|nr:hypothetical protein HELRODRAFT_175208 [Helobdella robusta]ESO01180.1 hypothetical protein HELRODRAFT_175208 [Helobdella robusta]
MAKSSDVDVFGLKFLNSHFWRGVVQLALFLLTLTKIVHRTITLNISPNLKTNNNNILLDNPNNRLTFCCGKPCKDRKGLSMHQRVCKVYKSLKSRKSEVEPNNSEDNNPTTFQHTSTPTTTPKPFPGIKLSKSSSHWAEAYVFFHMELKCLEDSLDVDSFAISFQNIIY